MLSDFKNPVKVFKIVSKYDILSIISLFLQMTYYVYIIKCSDNSFYTGVTNDVHKRFLEHCSSNDKKSYTYSRKPLELVFFAEFKEIGMAIEKEKQIKGWSRAKKQALIDNDFTTLINLAKKKF